MRATTKAAILLILPLMIIGLVACGSDDGVAAGQIADTPDDVQVVADQTHDDGDDHIEAVADTHDDGDEHADLVADVHDDEGMESSGHAHMDSPIDPDAPVMHLTAAEFAYGTSTLEAEAGEAFTIQISNMGLLEHDITFEGLEDEGGVHVQPGEESAGTFSIHEAGEYVYYCTVLGHREAGMTGTMMVSAGHMEDHDETDGHHDEDAAMHDEMEAAHDDAELDHEDADELHDEVAPEA
ncbi:MAG: hypothetical protein HQ477_08515 [Chloroflexi bacterium]|nr:hypothetical protein [Chloroflexota bacterium]